jgi:hypothetical protein
MSPLLVVGGTDGSGTRRVVQLLADLGVVMVSEDPGTFDIHGAVMKGGWPPVIKPVLEAAGGNIGYDATLLPPSLVASTSQQLTNLLVKVISTCECKRHPSAMIPVLTAIQITLPAWPRRRGTPPSPPAAGRGREGR